VATVTRLVGDVDVAEDAVQDACTAALARWSVVGVPGNPRAWLIGTARHKALDRLRREAKRGQKEEAAVEGMRRHRPPEDAQALRDDELCLIFMCCHPALDPAVRVSLTLRAVCGLSTAEIARAFFVPEATMTKRLVRAKRKISDSGIPFRIPQVEELPARLAAVLRVIYLVFTEGHMATSGPALVRGELCDAAIRLARTLAELLPGEPEVIGLLALLLLTDARRDARIHSSGELVLLGDQDRTLWDRALVSEGETLVEHALRMGRPGPYQVRAAIAACHSTAPSAAGTDWRQIAALYAELIRHEPTAEVEANRAVAVAMAEGPAAGLVILDVLDAHPQLRSWPQLHVARAELMRRLGREEDAVDAYRRALQLEPPAAQRVFIDRRIRELTDG
jgi:RNA polymerase sigma-70 factor, ECF subfamily